jgi:hypothetical protein
MPGRSEVLIKMDTTAAKALAATVSMGMKPVACATMEREQAREPWRLTCMTRGRRNS